MLLQEKTIKYKEHKDSKKEMEEDLQSEYWIIEW